MEISDSCLNVGADDDWFLRLLLVLLLMLVLMLVFFLMIVSPSTNRRPGGRVVNALVVDVLFGFVFVVGRRWIVCSS